WGPSGTVRVVGVGQPTSLPRSIYPTGLWQMALSRKLFPATMAGPQLGVTCSRGGVHPTVVGDPEATRERRKPARSVGGVKVARKRFTSRSGSPEGGDNRRAPQLLQVRAAHFAALTAASNLSAVKAGMLSIRPIPCPAYH